MTPPFHAGQPTAAGSPPRDVQTAFQLFIAYVVFGLAGAILSFTLAGPIVENALKQLGEQERAQFEAGIRAAFIVGVVIALVILALYVFFVFQMRAGRNWSRIVLTVLGAISVTFNLIGFGSFGAYLQAGSLGFIYVVIVVIQLVLLVAGLVFMYRPAANAYFTA